MYFTRFFVLVSSLLLLLLGQKKSRGKKLVTNQNKSIFNFSLDQNWKNPWNSISRNFCLLFKNTILQPFQILGADFFQDRTLSSAGIKHDKEMRISWVRYSYDAQMLWPLACITPFCDLSRQFGLFKRTSRIRRLPKMV